ncbi:ABC transporter permease subunit [Paenibacillus apiarius]|uniref:ABC transporter permease subunit n=2 Tax=Paenibacillus apiarius TaxID=46240 RepID=A0ABT4E0F4_9BACL|nr:ABC transporter permease subunit [Paenibacillus apiarius]MCY9522480.1 ABC transporter permease subunit [Paenibacillus apiarius]MCY9554596.1 ABC transporter permease subunit [Paenibacillus apiarius]MCY9556712.1 ABC transporter permease subunit [Paenibacillus apiarius]MCY9686607.1 ABC transporter permease subunit [Paenibacillus apiarius]
MVWQAVGYYMIIYIAAIQGIPNDIYEAAVIDGAGEWKQFTHMTVPLIWGILRITIIFLFI